MSETPASRRWLAAGGIAGPVGFISAWAACGAATKGYSPIDDAISRLAATGAPHRAAMTAGMVGLGLGVVVYAVALRDAAPGRAWLAAVACGAATLGVAATPLDSSPTVDGLHAGFALAAYASLALVPWLAAEPLQQMGRTGAARTARVAAVVAGAALVGSLLGAKSGLLQRTGLTALDAWIAASAVLLLTGRWSRTRNRVTAARPDRPEPESV